jgi:hypothetical protein
VYPITQARGYLRTLDGTIPHRMVKLNRCAAEAELREGKYPTRADEARMVADAF